MLACCVVLWCCVALGCVVLCLFLIHRILEYGTLHPAAKQIAMCETTQGKKVPLVLELEVGAVKKKSKRGLVITLNIEFKPSCSNSKGSFGDETREV